MWCRSNDVCIAVTDTALAAQVKNLNGNENCSIHTTTLPSTVSAKSWVNSFQADALLTLFHETIISQFAMFCMSILGQPQRQ